MSDLSSSSLDSSSIEEITARKSVSHGIMANLKNLVSAFGDKKEAFMLFEKNLLFLKGFGVFFLLTMALINWYLNNKSLGFVAKDQKRFAIESLVFALGGVIPFLILVFLRNEAMSAGKIVFSVIFLLVLFVAINYALEISGFYAVVFEYNKEEKEKDIATTDYTSQFKRSFSYTSDLFMSITFLLALLCMLFASLLVHDYHPRYIRLTGIPTPILFIIEMILFGAISAVPIYLMAHNRDRLDAKHTSIEFLLITAKFALLHCILQLSGFYTYTFKGEIPQ